MIAKSVAKDFPVVCVGGSAGGLGRLGALPTWADVFRRIGLDERDHMNMSFVFCDIPEWIITCDGLPEKPGLINSK